MSTAQNPWPHIGQLFVEEGYLTSAQLERALAEQRKTGERLGEILIERGYITRIHLAGALSKQWSWRGEVPRSIESHETSLHPPQETVEPEPVVAVPEFVLVPELPPTDPPPAYPNANGTPAAAPAFREFEGDVQSQASPAPTVEESRELAPSPVRIEALAAPVSGLEDHERLLRELQARLRDTEEQLAAGEARIAPLEAILAELSQVDAALSARLDAQAREIEDLRRVIADQASRLATAASALLA
jgi:uncharacterized coiled-coil protein SlyX